MNNTPPTTHHPQPTTSIIVATSENNCIGRGGEIPWYISEDFKRLKEITMGKPLIMGRKTYEGIADKCGGKPLPGRDSLIISRSMQKPDFENTFVHSSLESAMEHGKQIALEKQQPEIIIFGGAQIYKEALEKELVDKIYLTKVHMEIADGDAFFPETDAKKWKEISREMHETEDGLGYSYVTLMHKT